MGAQAGVLLVSAAAAATSIVGAILLTRNIVFHLERVRDASHELASGDLAARAPESGPTEVAELAASFNAMAGHVEEVFDTRRELVAWASHDLRAPITSLQAMLEAMEDGVVEPHHYLETLHGQVRLLSTLVDDLFEMACIDSGAITLAVEPVELGVLVEGFLQHYELEARALGVRVRTVMRDEHAWALCAPDKVERVLTNIVTNALRHTPSGGVVTASVTSGAGAVFVSLEDSGAGVADGERERIFEPFWRGDPAAGALHRRGRAGPGDRPGLDRRAERPHLGRDANSRRHPDLLRAAGGPVGRNATRRGSRPAPDRRPVVASSRMSCVSVGTDGRP